MRPFHYEHAADRAQALKAAGYRVKSDLNLGSETEAHQAVKNGIISGYPEDASTALTSFFGFKPEHVPISFTRAAELANEEFEKEGLTAQLAASGAQITGVDASESMVAAASARGLESASSFAVHHHAANAARSGHRHADPGAGAAHQRLPAFHRRRMADRRSLARIHARPT